MAPRSEALEQAWRALGGQADGPGWRTIALEPAGACRILAGRHAPGQEEAVIFGFPEPVVGRGGKLPTGHGFQVVLLPPGQLAASHIWICLWRHASASREFFALMAKDVLQTLDRMAVDDRGLVDVVLRRIRAWQDFMERGRDPVLSAQAELGLFGELLVLEQILAWNVDPLQAVTLWTGPKDRLHDFTDERAALEVKTSTASGTFPANIESIEQLDDASVQPLYLVAVRVAFSADGESLPELAMGLAARLAVLDQGAAELFNTRLVDAGLLMAVSNRYTRRFVHVTTRVLPVDERLPRLTRAALNHAIIAAAYCIDLDRVDVAPVDLNEALVKMGWL